MRFLVDGCVGRRLAEWLRVIGHDVIEADRLGPDPGDIALLEMAASADRIFVTIDTDFGELIYRHGQSHTGLVRLPDVPSEQRIALLDDAIQRYGSELQNRAIVTIRGARVRISRPSAG